MVDLPGDGPLEKEEISGDIKKDLFRPILKSLNGTITSLQKLERDLQISDIAWLDVRGVFEYYEVPEIERDTFKILKLANTYKKRYWKAERKIKQGFLSYMKRKGFLPSNSPELNSLKNNLPETIIKGDERIWIYSYDQYIDKIAEEVGRDKENAPPGRSVWKHFHEWSKSDIERILRDANGILPRLHWLKAKIQMALRNPHIRWSDLKVKTPRVETVERPIRKLMIIKRPFPLDSKKKMPKKRILKKPKLRTIGPGEDSK